MKRLNVFLVLMVCLFFAVIGFASLGYDDGGDVGFSATTAESVEADTTNFDGILSGADDEVQKALDTIDDVMKSSASFAAILNGTNTWTGLNTFHEDLTVQTTIFTNVLDTDEIFVSTIHSKSPLNLDTPEVTVPAGSTYDGEDISELGAASILLSAATEQNRVSITALETNDDLLGSNTEQNRIDIDTNTDAVNDLSQTSNPFFLTNELSPSEQYFLMTTSETSGVESTIVSDLDSATVVVATYTIETPLDLDRFRSGNYHFHFHADVDNATKETRLRAEVFKGTGTGSSYLFSTVQSNIITTDKTFYDTHITTNEILGNVGLFNVRVVADVTGGGPDPVLTLYMEGTTDTNFEIPTLLSDSAVTKIIAGTDITISPTTGRGEVTINAVCTPGTIGALPDTPDVVKSTHSAEIRALGISTETNKTNIALNKGEIDDLHLSTDTITKGKLGISSGTIIEQNIVDIIRNKGEIDDLHLSTDAITKNKLGISSGTIIEQNISDIATLALSTGTVPKSYTVVVGFTKDVDFLCDGTADDVQINAALASLQDTSSGTVILREGVYDITANLAFRTEGTSLMGQGYSTIMNYIDPNPSNDILMIEMGFDKCKVQNILFESYDHFSEGIINCPGNDCDISGNIFALSEGLGDNVIHSTGSRNNIHDNKFTLIAVGTVIVSIKGADNMIYSNTFSAGEGSVTISSGAEDNMIFNNRICGGNKAIVIEAGANRTMIFGNNFQGSSGGIDNNGAGTQAFGNIGIDGKRAAGIGDVDFGAGYVVTVSTLAEVYAIRFQNGGVQVSSPSCESLGAVANPMTANLDGGAFYMFNIGSVTIIGKFTGDTMELFGKLTMHETIDIRDGKSLKVWKTGNVHNVAIQWSGDDVSINWTDGNLNLGMSTKTVRTWKLDVTSLTIKSEYTFPLTDGTTGQAMFSNGAGNNYWGTISGGGGGNKNQPIIHLATKFWSAGDANEALVSEERFEVNGSTRSMFYGRIPDVGNNYIVTDGYMPDEWNGDDFVAEITLVSTGTHALINSWLEIRISTAQFDANSFVVIPSSSDVPLTAWENGTVKSTVTITGTGLAAGKNYTLEVWGNEDDPTTLDLLIKSVIFRTVVN